MVNANTGIYGDDDGLITDVALYNGTNDEFISQLFICTSCRFTYIFSDGPYAEDAVETNVTFRESDENVTVYFQNETLALNQIDDGGLKAFTLIIGLIPTSY